MELYIDFLGYFLIFLFLLLWLQSAFIDYCKFCYFWQLKEYRVDRFKDFLSTYSGKKFLFSYSVFWRSIIYIIACFLLKIFLNEQNYDLTINLLFVFILLIFLIDLISNVFLLYFKQLKYPKITLKSIIFIIVSIFIEGILFQFFAFFDLSLAVLIFVCRWFIFSGLIILIKPTDKLIKIIYIKIAKEKLLLQKNLLVIGVTGSYGKTTVKNFLEQILAVKYRLIKTPANINTDIGIAKFIIKNKLSDFDIFIVEMGAYKRGEIKTICKLVKPKIGILTTISDQHLSLFGSQKNIQLAKYELLFSLPTDGLAITNSDNEYCQEYLSKITSQVKTFGKDQRFNPDCFIIDESVNNNQKINFTAEIKKNNKKLKISAPLIGQHNSFNIAPAILVGLFLNISDDDIIKQCFKLKMPPNTLQIHNYGESLIIDDSYNANPYGFLAALKVLDEYQGNREKIIITRGMLELGEKTQYWHEKIGKEIARVANKLIIISPDFVKLIKKGAEENKNLLIKTEFNTKKLLICFQQFKNKKCLILIENRLPQNIYKELVK